MDLGKPTLDTIVQEEEETPSNVIPFRAIQGGKKDSGNWLYELPEGTCFLTKKRTSAEPWHEEFYLACKTSEGMVLLQNKLSPHVPPHIWVDSQEFSDQYKPREIEPYQHMGVVTDET